MTEPERRRRPAPVVIAAAIVVIIITAGAVVDRVVPATPPQARPPRAITPGGIWVCPIVSFGRLGGYVSLANGSVEPSTVRVRFVRAGSQPVDLGLRLAPGHAASLRVPGDAPAGAIVQWAGGAVVAARSAALVTPARRTIATGAACSRAGDRTIVVSGLRTLGADAHVVMLNPSIADALVDVSFLVDGDEHTPETLTSRVVPARGRVDVRVSDFIFDKPSVAAVVRVRTGSVAADAVVITPQGAWVSPGSAPIRRGVAAALSSFGARVDVATPGDDPASIVSTTMTRAGRGTTTNFPAAFDPLSSSAVRFAERGPLSVALDSREGPGFGATLGWTFRDRGGGDAAALPFLAPAARFLAVTQSPIGSAGATMLLSNPGTEPVRLRARLLTSRGQVASGELADITLLPGRVDAFALGNVATSIGVEVVALGGEIGFSIVVAGGVGTAAFLYALGGISTTDAPSPPVRINPGTGVPARL